MKFRCKLGLHKYDRLATYRTAVNVASTYVNKHLVREKYYQDNNPEHSMDRADYKLCRFCNKFKIRLNSLQPLGMTAPNPWYDANMITHNYQYNLIIAYR
jgi:hypothetical protein